MDFADLVRNPGVEEDPLGRGRLPGIDVGHDADVPGPFERCLPRHCDILNHEGHEFAKSRIEPSGFVSFVTFVCSVVAISYQR